MAPNVDHVAERPALCKHSLVLAKTLLSRPPKQARQVRELFIFGVVLREVIKKGIFYGQADRVNAKLSL